MPGAGGGHGSSPGRPLHTALSLSRSGNLSALEPLGVRREAALLLVAVGNGQPWWSPHTYCTSAQSPTALPELA